MSASGTDSRHSGGRKESKGAKKSNPIGTAGLAGPPTSNWDQLKRKLSCDCAGDGAAGRKRKRHRQELTEAAQQAADVAAKAARKKPVFDVNADDDSHVDKLKYVALDCEMVGLGTDGKVSALARCAIVDYDGKVIYDEFVRPPGLVTDFRTKYSGIRKKDLRRDNAISLPEVEYACKVLCPPLN